MATSNDKHLTPLSAAGVLVSLGIIYGDIGTSPIYTLRFIVGHHPITQELILGGLSLVFWTLTIITSIKYISICNQLGEIFQMTGANTFYLLAFEFTKMKQCIW